MATATLPAATPATPPPAPARPAYPVMPARFRWTAGQYHLALEMGVWEGRKVILIDGELLEMPPPDPLHNSALGLADYLFKRIFAEGYWVRVQLPLVLGINTDPLPDLTVVPGDPRSVTTNSPTALLVVEVSNTSLSFDTGEKASLYAAAGIKDYWVIDAPGRRVLVYRDPIPDPRQPYGHGYASVTVLLPGQSLAPLAAPAAPVAAADLLP